MSTTSRQASISVLVSGAGSGTSARAPASMFPHESSGCSVGSRWLMVSWRSRLGMRRPGTRSGSRVGLQEASPGVVAYEGELTGRACEDFTVALDLLKISEAEAPVVDLNGVTRISHRGVDLLVSLQVDLEGQGRRFKLLASEDVWDALGRAGVAHVFVEGPPQASHERGEE